ncbi:hypothetical protein Ssi03_08080 [Sphaerisporangium siamense]|nr:hypothetical protein Ssi03_08080 [Sphaerisporangium siamense]
MGGAYPEAGDSLVAVGEPHRLFLKFPYGGQQDACPGEDQLTEGGGARAVPVALEESAAECAFDAFQLRG